MIIKGIVVTRKGAIFGERIFYNKTLFPDITSLQKMKRNTD